MGMLRLWEVGIHLAGQTPFHQLKIQQSNKHLFKNLMQFFQTIEEVPVRDQLRKRTDICCTIWAVLFSLTLFTIAVVGLNKDKALRSSLPSDADGKVCGVDYPEYGYLFYPEPQNPARKVCVTECPHSQNEHLKCKGAQCQSAHAYESEATNTPFGKYCVPSSQQIKQKFLQSTGLEGRQSIFDSFDKIKLGFLGALAIGLLFVGFVQLFPRCMNYFTIVTGGLLLIALGVNMIVYPAYLFPRLKLTLGILAIVLGVILVSSLWFYRTQLKINGIFLYHATQVVRTNCTILFYIPLFIFFALGLLGLSGFELGSFASSVSGADFTYLAVLGLIQLWWGMSFLKEFFSFCVAGNAIQWYFGKSYQDNRTCSHFCRALKFHFGSIVAGSFMVGFFAIPGFIVDLLRPVSQFSKYGRCYNYCFGWIDSLFSLVRTDAMAYVNLSGLPYCNSARYCDFLCNTTRLFAGSQSVTIFFKCAAHLLAAAALALGALYFRGHTSILAIVLIFLTTIFITTFFVSLHSDAAEALIITFLTHEYLAMGNYNLLAAQSPAGIVEELKITQVISY